MAQRASPHARAPRVRRIGHVWEQVLAFDNLLAATDRAARGKCRQPEVARFLERREPELFALERELRDGSWRPGSLRTLWVREPKPRKIGISPFRDRVVHHALIAPLEPRFDRHGMPFLGWCVYPGMIRLRRPNLRRVTTHLARRRAAWEAGTISSDALAASVRGTLAHLGHGNTRALRRRLFSTEALHVR